MNRSNSPILVTGAHRSGTTWVGKMLAAGGDLAYVSEPLNVWHRPGVMSANVEHWYTHISPENEADYLTAFQDTIALRYKLGRELLALRSPKDFFRILRDLTTFTRGRLANQRTLLKDPFALFSAPWFASKLDCQVVIVVRHPAALVSSHKRLGWSFSFNDILAQPRLIDDLLEPYRAQIEQQAKHSGDLIERACLLWNMIHYVVAGYQTSHPEFIIVRHEDLSSDPIVGFMDLYSQLNLPYSSHAQKAISRATGAGNPSELSVRTRHSVKLDSKANLKKWQSRLTQTEIDRIRDLTGAVAAGFYSDEDWE